MLVAFSVTLETVGAAAVVGAVGDVEPPHRIVAIVAAAIETSAANRIVRCLAMPFSLWAGPTVAMYPIAHKRRPASPDHRCRFIERGAAVPPCTTIVFPSRDGATAVGRLPTIG